MGIRLAYDSTTSRQMETGNSAEPSDLELVRRIRGGDSTAFDDLVLRKRAKILAVARRLVGDAEDAKDLAQLAFIRVWEKIEQYDERYAFNTWLYRIVTNLSIDLLRSRGTRERTAQGFLHVVRSQSEVAGPRVTWNLQARETERLWSKISVVLTERQRAVFVLKEIEGLDSKEVAEILGCGSSTVRNHLFNARKLLREEVRKHFPEYLDESDSGGGES